MCASFDFESIHRNQMTPNWPVISVSPRRKCQSSNFTATRFTASNDMQIESPIGRGGYLILGRDIQSSLNFISNLCNLLWFFKIKLTQCTIYFLHWGHRRNLFSREQHPIENSAQWLVWFCSVLLGVILQRLWFNSIQCSSFARQLASLSQQNFAESLYRIMRWIWIDWIRGQIKTTQESKLETKPCRLVFQIFAKHINGK